MKAPSVTQIGMAPTRAPAPDREELLKLARGVRARYRRTTTPQEELLVRLAEGLERTLLDLSLTELHVSEAERAIAASGLRVGELGREVERLKLATFEEPTARRESSADLLARAAGFDEPTEVR